MRFKASMGTAFIVCILCSSCGGGASSAELQAWEAAAAENSEKALESFLRDYPQSGYKAQAEQRLEALLWSFAEQEQTVYSYRYYAKRFPQGKHGAEVTSKIDALPKPELDFAELTTRTYSGVIRNSKEEIQILSLRFAQIEQNDQNISFVADINAGNNLRKAVDGQIRMADNAIVFEENPSDAVLFGLTEGRIYKQNNRILLQSTNPDLFWSMK